MTDTPEFKTLVMRRGNIKARLTKFSNFLETLTSHEEVVNSLAQIQVRLERIKGDWSEFDSTQTKIELIDKDNTRNEEERDNFEDTHFELVAKAEQLLSTYTSRSCHQRDSNTSPNSSDINLPKLTLPTFNGTSDDWPSFYELFSSIIHNNSKLNNVQKLQYLRMSLKGDAAAVIESLPLREKNYEVAWSLITDRYQDTNLMIMNHVRDLFSVQKIDFESAAALHRLLDITQKHVRALKALDQPTDHWDLILVHLISSKLDSTSYKEWQELCADSASELPTFSKLKEFIQKRCQVLEAITKNTKRAVSKTSINANKSNLPSRFPNSNKFTKPVSHSSFVTTTKPKQINETNKQCLNCNDTHNIYQCPEFLQLTIPQRTKLLNSKQACLNCLRTGHPTNLCRSGKCRRCGEHHNTLLHHEQSSQPMEKRKDAQENPSPIISSNTTQPVVSTLAALPSQIISVSTAILSTVLIDIENANGIKILARGLLDCGSQCSFITEALAQHLKLMKHKCRIPVTGIGEAQTQSTRIVNAIVRSRHSDYKTHITFHVLPRITGSVPSESIKLNMSSFPSVQLADPFFYKSTKIDMLLGADIFWQLIEEGKINITNSNIQLRETRLGWIVTGPNNEPATVGSLSSITCLLSVQGELGQQLERFWEIEDCQPRLTAGDRCCETHYSKTTIRKPDGRYIVKLPLKAEPSTLGDSKSMALKRFLMLEKRLHDNKELHEQYSTFINEYIQLGHMVKLSPDEVASLPSYAGFLPHHPVFKESSSTTKIRVVFDASATTSNGISLNNIMLAGSVIQDDLFSLITRFRIHNIVLCADIEKMYRQIEVDKTDTVLQLIFWRESIAEPIGIYRLLTVTYGTTSAPFLATRTLHQLAEDEKMHFPRAAEVLVNDFYVDDLMTGCHALQEAQKLQKDLELLLQRGGFNIRKWNSNSQELLQTIHPDNRASTIPMIIDHESKCKTLGLTWDSSLDEFRFFINVDLNQDFTKRKVLSIIAKIFDPLGLLGPIITRAKTLMQRLWLSSIDWDEQLLQPLLTEWKEFYKSLNHINQLTIPRQITSQETIVSIELHGFSDASEVAYGAVVYMRTVDTNGNILVNLIASKSKVAPLKSLSIPRLELCGALLLAQFVHRIQQSLRQSTTTFLWTDSTIVLAWLASTPTRWTTFVRNRVSMIQDLIPYDNWKHVRGQENPADLISRGLNGNQLANESPWWHGPSWLSRKEQFWHKHETITDVESIPEERSSITSGVASIHSNNIKTIVQKSSSFTRLVRIISHCLTFIDMCRTRSKTRINSIPTVEELDKALQTLVRQAQGECFERELKELYSSNQVNKKSKLSSLAPFLDKNGIIRVGGRLHNSSLTHDRKHPMVLPAHHHLTNIIARHEHVRLNHAGPLATLASMRQRYWPINGRNLVKRIIHQCITCYRAKPKPSSQLMGQLPAARVTPSRPFFHTGVDYCGPIMVRTSTRRNCPLTKAYIAVFVCFATKALHVELVEDMSTPAFLNALRRFVSRRGRPLEIYSDNGSNFIGANRELQLNHITEEEQRKKIQGDLSLQGIQWKFIPPAAPNFGGLWESGVRLIKYHLKRVLGTTNLTYIDMTTLLTQIEAIINSRPITPISSDPSDLQPLTPAHFLIGEPLTSIPEPSTSSLNINRLDRFQRIQLLRQHFWNRWSTAYLGELQLRSKWRQNSQNIKKGALVLIKQETQPPMAWKLGRIEDVHPGTDGLIRVVTLRTPSGTMKRPISKICPLPISDEEADTNQDNSTSVDNHQDDDISRRAEC